MKVGWKNMLEKQPYLGERTRFKSQVKDGRGRDGDVTLSTSMKLSIVFMALPRIWTMGMLKERFFKAMLAQNNV